MPSKGQPYVNRLETVTCISVLGPLNLGNGALGKKFDAYPQRQSVTESSYNNSLAYHRIWSTIKTLPATLPEPSSEVRAPIDAIKT